MYHSILLVLLTRLALINIQCLPRFSLHYQEIVINVNRERDKCLSFRPSFESINSSKWHAVGLNCWLSDARISSIPAPFRRLMRTGSFSSNFKGKTVNVDRIILPYSSDPFSHWQCSTLLNYTDHWCHASWTPERLNPPRKRRPLSPVSSLSSRLFWLSTLQLRNHQKLQPKSYGRLLSWRSPQVKEANHYRWELNEAKVRNRGDL